MSTCRRLNCCDLDSALPPPLRLPLSLALGSGTQHVQGSTPVVDEVEVSNRVSENKDTVCCCCSEEEAVAVAGTINASATGEGKKRVTQERERRAWVSPSERDSLDH